MFDRIYLNTVGVTTSQPLSKKRKKKELPRVEFNTNQCSYIRIALNHIKGITGSTSFAVQLQHSGTHHHILPGLLQLLPV